MYIYLDDEVLAKKSDERCAKKIAEIFATEIQEVFTIDRWQTIAEMIGKKLPEIMTSRVSCEQELEEEWEAIGFYGGDEEQFHEYDTPSEETKIYESKTEKTFQEFHNNHKNEQKYLYSKIPPDQLDNFSKKIFNLEAIFKCKYISLYLEKKNLNLSDFKKILKEYEERKTGKAMKETQKFNINKAYKYIFENCDKENFKDYKNFSRNERTHLIEAVQNIFNSKDIMARFKGSRAYEFSPLEAIFMIYITDEKNKVDFNHIRFNEWTLVHRKFLKTIKNYAIAIAKDRGWEHISIKELYNEKIFELKSDLPRIREVINEIENSANEKDSEKLKSSVKTCIKKLKKFENRQITKFQTEGC